MSLKLGTTSIPGIRVIEDSGPAGGGSADSGVLFIDYDGTELELWPSADVASKSALPANPTHTGLTAQGWNWSLSDIKSYISSYPEATVVVGQMYATTSGATEIDITLDDANYLSPYLGLRINGTVVIDWGDDSSTDTVTGTNIGVGIFTQHVYSSVGNYTISIKETSGNYKFQGAAGTSVVYGTILFKSNTTYNDGGYYRQRINAIRLGTGITDTGAYAFHYCTNLKTITFHSLVTFPNTYSFNYCTNLKCVVIPSGITSIPNYFVQYCWNLSYISCPNSITSIGISLVRVGLKQFTIPSSLTTLSSILSYAHRLKKIIIPNSVTTIGGVFTSCYDILIKSLNKVTTINGTIAENNYTISSITIPATVTSLYDSAFKGMYSLTEIINKSNITSFAMSTGSAWANCCSLTTIPFSFTGTSIPTNYFQNCNALKSVNIPNNYTSIGNYAFSNCYSLGPSFTIPNTVTSIGNQAFSSCYGLLEIHVKPTSPPTLGTNVFNNTNNNLVIYVPQASLSAYQTATNWSSYASKMQGE